MNLLDSTYSSGWEEYVDRSLIFERNIMHRSYTAILPCLAMLASAGFSQQAPRLEPLRVMASWEMGQIESFEKGAGGPVIGDDKQLINHSGVWMLQEARLSDRARAYVGVGGMYFFILPSAQNQYSFGQRSAFGLTDAHGEYDAIIGENGDVPLRIKVGIFPYKYNEDAKNLGEYMFRTYTYPNIITGGGLVFVNSAGVQLNGAAVETHIGGLKNDLILSVKTDQVPSAALSLSDIVSYRIGNFLTVGAGYMFDNFYSADGLNDGMGSDEFTFPQEYYWELADGRKVLYGSSLNPGDSVVATRHFEFNGQKAVWRASLDLGNLIPFAGIASNTFKLYYEGVLMGVENRPIFYENRSDRIAHMLGANIPTFGVLDMLSAEVEYNSSPYAPDLSNATLYLSPTPKDNQGSNFTGDDLKWSFYARKEVLPGFAVTAQAARDHIRLVDFYGHTNDSEVLLKRKDWYWAVQLSYTL